MPTIASSIIGVVAVSEDQECVVSLYDWFGVLMILLRPSGVIYVDQTGGQACILQSRAEGVLVPWNNDPPLLGDPAYASKFLTKVKCRHGRGNILLYVVVRDIAGRGNARMEVFRKDDDYAAFLLKLLVEASERIAMRLLAYCLMLSHFHLVKCGRLYGSDEWQRRTAKQLGLEASIRPRGRPRKTSKK